jgi:hypothetical protein
MGTTAQLEAMDGRFDEAIDMARQAVRDLESLGYAQVKEVRAVLKRIEARAADAKGEASGSASSWLQKLKQAIAREEAEGPDALDTPAGPRSRLEASSVVSSSVSQVWPFLDKVLGVAKTNLESGRFSGRMTA